MLRTIGILSICGLAMSIGSGSAQATDPDLAKTLADIQRQLTAVQGNLNGITTQVNAIQHHVGGKIIRPVPQMAFHTVHAKPFPKTFNDVLDREWTKHQEREETKKVACFLKGLLNEYGECCDPCTKPTTRTSSFLHPACYTTSSSVTTIASPRSFLVPACYTTYGN